MGLRRKRSIVRLIKLIDLCRSRRRYLPTLAELAAEHRCHQRTIRRDLESLEEAGVAVPAWRIYDTDGETNSFGARSTHVSRSAS